MRAFNTWKDNDTVLFIVKFVSDCLDVNVMVVGSITIWGQKVFLFAWLLSSAHTMIRKLANRAQRKIKTNVKNNVWDRGGARAHASNCKRDGCKFDSYSGK